MKIAIVTEHFLPKTDGLVTRICNTVRWLKHNGHEVRIYTIEGSPPEYEGMKVSPLKSISLPFLSNRKIVIPNKQIHSLMDEWVPDLVHVINPSLLGWYALQHAEKQSWPAILSLHTDYAQYADYYHLSFAKGLIWELMRQCAAHADCMLTPSTAMQKTLLEHDITAKLWKYGADTENFRLGRRDESMRDYLTQGDKNKFLFIYTGRLAAEKDLFRLKDILLAYPDVCLALIGDGPLKEKLADHFAGTACLITGFMYKEKLAQAYASADAMVFPSQTETLGLVLIEAMASGLPVVAARAGGVTDIIEDSVNGLLFDPLDKSDFLNKCAEIRHNKSLAKQIVKNAALTAKNANWENATAALISTYEETIQLHATSTKKIIDGKLL